ncbi:MAG: histidine kinase dimerization/phosphoacceptor domain -containing protein [bacterium]|nr:histidine kinase dimerization/phosphoacceptor domain -containing protein [bacterium]MDT8365123.1 histidine kinase dimerization/phosphoacceptor domain -containing protein [bacterium]
MKKYLFKKLTTRLVTTFALLAIPGALLVGYSSYYLARTTLESSIYDKLEGIASIKEENLRWWISGLKSDVENIAGAESLRRPLRAFMLGIRGADEVAEAYDSMSKTLAWFKGGNEDIREVFLLTRDGGRVFLSTEKTHEGDYRINDGYFIKGLEDTYVQKVFTSPVIHRPNIVISTPLVSLYGEKLGVFAARLDLDRIDKVFLERAGLGRSGEAYLVDKFNNSVSSKRFGREDYPRGVHSMGIDAGVKGADGRGLYRNYQGIRVIGVYHWLEDLDLLLMAEIHQSEAFGPARRLGWSLFLLGMSIAAIVLLGSYFVSGKIVRPILMVRDAAALVAKGDLSAKAPVITGDEVGMLAASFNEMTDHLELLYKALQSSEEHFRTVFRLSPDAISVIRMRDETFVDINEGFTNITGFTREEMIGRTTRTAGIWIDDETRETFLKELRDQEHLDKQEVRFFKKDGSVFISSISAKKVDIAGEPHRISVIRDVTSLREAQSELWRTNAILRTQMELSMSGILVLDEKDSIISCNHRYMEMWGIPQKVLDSGSDEQAVQSVLDKIADPDGFLEKRRNLMDQKDVRYQGEILLKDGQIFEEYAAPMLDEDGLYLGRVIYFRDITQDRHSEDILRSSVREKEVLLQEIHHRVKNNLQVISGLMDLQSYHITDDSVKGVYKESRNRVITMALIHEELYQSRNLAQVDYGTYIRNLVNNLFKSYAVDLGKVKLNIQAENMLMVVDTGIPCGLIINELITNAFKHAFPDGREGEVTIIFRQAGEGKFHLEVNDDGVGIPEDIDIRKTQSLGLQLVTMLVEQLSGEMRINSDKGTSFVIEFEEYREAGVKLY